MRMTRTWITSLPTLRTVRFCNWPKEFNSLLCNSTLEMKKSLPSPIIINGQIKKLPRCYSLLLKAHFTSRSPRWPPIQRLWADETTRGSSPQLPDPGAALPQPWFQRWSDFLSVPPNVHLSRITSTGDVEQMWLRGRRLARADFQGAKCSSLRVKVHLEHLTSLGHLLAPLYFGFEYVSQIWYTSKVYSIGEK